MRTVRLGLALAAFGFAWLLATHAAAQQATVATPFRQLNDGFYENMGTAWSLQGKGWNFNFGSPNNAAPQFGGFQPGTGANFGAAMMRGGVTGQLYGNWSHGYRQSLVSQTPSVTLQNGVPGSVADVSVSPFVMGFIPVVGNYPMLGGYPLIGALTPTPTPVYGNTFSQGAAIPSGTAAVQEALRRAKADSAGDADKQVAEAVAEGAGLRGQQRPASKARVREDDLSLGGGAAGSLNQPAGPVGQLQASSAGRAAPSVAEAKRLRAAEEASQDGEALKYMELARSAEEAGKPSVAKLYYQMAARRASGELKTQILARLNDLTGQSQGVK